MADRGVEGQDWSGEELDLIVADYYSMLADESVGVHYNKAEHRRMLQRQINRSDGSIEFKHQNISAVLQRLGLPRIKGYLPATNYQKAIISAVDRYLSLN